MQQDVLEREHKEYTVLKAVYDLSKPEQGRGVSEEDVAKHAGLSLAEASDILERLLIYKLIGCPDYNSGYVSTLATRSKLLDYAKSVNQANTHVTNNFHASVGAVQYGDRNVAHVTQNNYSHQNLTDAAREIQQLLNQLAQTYPANTQAEKLAIVTKAVEQIENDRSWKDRVIAALRSAGVEGIKELVDNPLVNIFLAVVEGWQEG